MGIIQADNAIIGTENDFVGWGGITALPNGNYVVKSHRWADYAGAVTWGNGDGSTSLTVSAANSLVGAGFNSAVVAKPTNSYNDPVMVLANGHYVVLSPHWNDGTNEKVGAITWANGDGSTVGVVSPLNSLVGTTADDQLGFHTVTTRPRVALPLANGNYVIGSSKWGSQDYGATTWGNGTGGTVGAVSANNSLVGSLQGDVIGRDVIALSDGSYLTRSISWDNGPYKNVGAITWSDGSKSTSENLAPVLTAIGDRTTYVGKTLSFDADADDGNLPVQTLTFSLEPGAPHDATIDPVSGQFSWTAYEMIPVGVYPITITVRDDGYPGQTDSETFTVTVEAVNLVSNYGFENPGSNEKLAAGWAAIQLTTNDRRMCDTETKSYAREGACAYRFSITKNTTLKRTIQKTASKAGLVKNDTLEVRGWVKATNLTAGARLTLTVTYNNGTTKGLNVNLSAGTYEYQLFSNQVTLTRPVKSLKVKIEARKAKGTFLVDDMAVVKVEPDPLALSLPAVPDLRGSQ